MFDLLNHFRIQFLATALIGVCLALACRQRHSAWMFATVAGLNFAFTAPLYIRPPEPPPALNELSLISYNTWRRNEDWESIARFLDEAQFDLVYLTEVHAVVAENVASLEGEFHLFQKGGEVLLIRRRANLEPQLLDGALPEWIPGLAIKLTVEGVPLCVLAVHPSAPRNRQASEQRDEAFRLMAADVRSRKGLGIVVGDLNATSWSIPFRELLAETGYRNSQAGFGVQPTWPHNPGCLLGGLMRIPIDHCLHSPEIHTLQRSVGGAGGSNHHPLLLRLGIPQGSK